MGVLDKLTLTDTAKSKGYDPIRVRRRKLAAAIQDQLGLLSAEAEGGVYRKTVRHRVRDLETDVLVETEQQRRVSPWWWTDDNGMTNLAIRYGSTVLKLKGGKTTVVLKSHDELSGILAGLKTDVLAGRFDEVLAQAAAELRERFGTEEGQA
ncbi:hypothetical protein [Caulobacter sp. S45]|uniref:hypothetical protein n=1 Tax=Caulobacter sp. S45 TaxID=1641861 RepID=UPI001C2052F4|nr:hypothetical protein [Caulobacter sp. S45]